MRRVALKTHAKHKQNTLKAQLDVRKSGLDHALITRWRGAEWMMCKRTNANARSMMLDDGKCYSTCAYVLPKPLTNMCKHSSCLSGMSILDIPTASYPQICRLLQGIYPAKFREVKLQPEKRWSKEHLASCQDQSQTSNRRRTLKGVGSVDKAGACNGPRFYCLGNCRKLLTSRYIREK